MLGLAFSGGKDSWACLWLNRARLADITVIWVNTGKNYPELLDTIRLAREMCPDFVEVNVRRSDAIPADVVPVDWTLIGQAVTSRKPVMVQPYIECCWESIGQPLMDRAKLLGITHLIRGQRMDEGHTSLSRDGTVVDGITFLHPIEDWTRDEVLEYVGQHMAIPEHFRLNHSSMDCYDCTAYRKDSRDRIEWMRERHPELHQEYVARKDALDLAIRSEL